MENRFFNVCYDAVRTTKGGDKMSLYMDMRFRGIVKEQFRDSFESIALEGRWKESKDQLLQQFGNNYVSEFIPIPIGGVVCPYGVSQWEREPWERKYDRTTGEWQFMCSFNVRYRYQMLKEWEDEIIPYVMECVEHYETWIEPEGNEPYTQKTLFRKFVNGEWIYGH